MDDPFVKELDVVAVNKYMGWYHPWPVEPGKAVWDVAAGQPLIISEFGGEALYGRSGDEETASSWSEEYQAKLYRDNIAMFHNIPNLRGVSPWILFDFRSPFRFHPANQEGWNRKGLVSEQGYRKKAWHVMKEYFDGCTGGERLETVVDNALNFSEKQYLLLAGEYAGRDSLLPRSFEQGEDTWSDSRWWTSGFFPGSLWYLYENNRNPGILKYARLFTSRVEREKYTTDNHDVGFMLYCSAGNGLRLTGDKHYEEVLLTGANSLATRYKPGVGLIRSWDHSTDRWQYPVIIDNIMNLELLLWAYDYSGERKFREIAVSHANKTMEHHFRPDYSSYHVVSYDTVSGLPHIKQTHQGYSGESMWSRGQAWGLYGYTYLYRELKDERYLRQAQNIADLLIHHPNMPEDCIPYWDYDSPDIPNTVRDASAACIMASALIELSDYVDKGRAKEYMTVVGKQIRTLASPGYRAELGENGCFILKHGTGAYPFNSEIDVPLTYADYYFLEALTRLKKRMK
jgi:hypothetical protein